MAITTSLADTSLRKLEINPQLYLKKLQDIEKGKADFTKAQLDTGLMHWAKLHTSNPRLIKEMTSMKEPLQFAKEYLLEKQKAKNNDHSRPTSQAGKMAAAFLDENASPEYKTAHEKELKNSYAPEIKPDYSDMQGELLLVAKHSEPGEAVSALLLAAALGESIMLAVRSALLLLNKYLHGNKNEKSICLSGLMGVIKKEQFNKNIKDDFENIFRDEKDPELVGQIAHINDWIGEDAPADKAAPSGNTVKAYAFENAQDVTSSKLIPQFTQPTSTAQNKKTNPFLLPPKPTDSWFTGTVKKTDD